MSTDPRIDSYIAKAAPFAQPILTHVRALVHRMLPGAGETIKWSMPTLLNRDCPYLIQRTIPLHVSRPLPASASCGGTFQRMWVTSSGVA